MSAPRQFDPGTFPADGSDRPAPAVEPWAPAVPATLVVDARPAGTSPAGTAPIDVDVTDEALGEHRATGIATADRFVPTLRPLPEPAAATRTAFRQPLERRVARLVTLASVLLVLPVFLHVNGTDIGLGQPDKPWLRTPGATVAVNTLATALLAIVVAVACRQCLPRVAPNRLAMLWCFVAANVAAFTWGAVASGGGEATTVGVLFLIQSLLPLTSFYLWYRLGAATGLNGVRRLGSVAGGVLGAVCLALLVGTVRYGIDERTGFHDAIGPLVISRATRFFPTVVSVFACWQLILGWQRRALVRMVLGGACFALLTIGHSRTALLIGLTLTAVTLVRLTSGRRRALWCAALLSIGAIGLGVLSQMKPTEGSGNGVFRSVSRLSNVTAESDINANRIDAVVNSLANGLGRPFGRAYQATETRSTNGEQVAVARVAVSENLYGEFAMRGGPLVLVSFMGILVVAVRSAASLRARRRQDRLAVAWLAPAVVLLVAVGGLTQLNATEFTVAPVSWGLMGLAMAVADRRRVES